MQISKIGGGDWVAYTGKRSGLSDCPKALIHSKEDYLLTRNAKKNQFNLANTQEVFDILR